MAPSVITLLDIENKTELVMDFNEEDNKKEEKKENKVKDFFLSFQNSTLTDLNEMSSKVSSYYLESNYFFSNSIFLPPPEHTS